MTDCKQRSKAPGDLEVIQSPNFLSSTPLGNFFQNEAIPLSEDIKACKHVMNILVRPATGVFNVAGRS